ncbi:MAG: G1 family glutamic endopeptidase [Candidatus Sulfotelmatobacter sp.]
MTSKFSVTLVSAVLSFGLTLTAAAQSDALRSLYQSSATIPTNIEGIFTYPAPPEGFNALAASDEELAAYGIPLRPDKVQDPDGYRQWTRLALLMSNPHNRWYGELKPRKARSSLATASPAAAGEQGTTFGATSPTSSNWSGVVNTLSSTKWSNKESFSWVTGEFNVPVPQQAFANGGGNICDDDNDQAAFWVGLGGFPLKGHGNQNNVAQTGVDISESCDGIGIGGSGENAWVEWFPGPNAQLFNVNPGDDIYVYVQSNSATSVSYTIVDHTIPQVATGTISAPAGVKSPSGVDLCPKPCVNVGNEAEYIVERPEGDTSTHNGLYPLANYGWSFWAFSRAKGFNGIYYYPGGTSDTTYDLSMTDDSGKQIISAPYIDKGLQNLVVQALGCAVILGCTP